MQTAPEIKGVHFPKLSLPQQDSLTSFTSSGRQKDGISSAVLKSADCRYRQQVSHPDHVFLIPGRWLAQHASLDTSDSDDNKTFEATRSSARKSSRRSASNLHESEYFRGRNDQTTESIRWEPSLGISTWSRVPLNNRRQVLRHSSKLSISRSIGWLLGILRQSLGGEWSGCSDCNRPK